MQRNERVALVVTTVHNPKDNRIWFKQIGSLRQAGWSVEYLCREEGAPQDDDGLKVVPVPLAKSRLLRVVMGNLVLLWRGLFSRAAILHVHDPELFVTARLLGWRFRRVVIDLHDLPHEQVRYKPYLHATLKRPLSRVTECMLSVALFRATVVIAESSYLDWTSRTARRTVLVRNFPRISGLPAKGDKKCDPAIFRLGYVGVISRARHVDDVAGALSLIRERIGKQVTLRLIGAFESHALEEEVLAREGVEYLGFRPNDQTGQLLADTDVGIALTARTPNYDHSLSTKILEYILIGLPVIASDNPINRELFADFPTVLLVEPGKLDAFVEAVAAAHATPSSASVLEEARRRVRAEMNWDVEFGRLLVLYETAVNGSGT